MRMARAPVECSDKKLLKEGLFVGVTDMGLIMRLSRGKTERGVE